MCASHTTACLVGRRHEDQGLNSILENWDLQALDGSDVVCCYLFPQRGNRNWILPCIYITCGVNTLMLCVQTVKVHKLVIVVSGIRNKSTRDADSRKPAVLLSNLPKISSKSNGFIR